MLNITGAVDPGLRSRNDDRLLVNKTVISEGGLELSGDYPCLVAVCDGVGGSSAGYIAAELALRELSSAWPLDSLDEEALRLSVERANSAVLAFQREDPEHSDICTTIAGILFAANKTLIFHAGDSRVYRLRGGYLKRLTNDHTNLQLFADSGIITQKEADSYGYLTRYLGSTLYSNIDVVEVPPAIQGDVFLVTTDGCWAFLDEKDLTEALSSADLTTAAALVALSKQKGSDDNISAAVVAVR